MNKFMEIAGKIGSQKHMVAIRDAFASTMPLVMAGAITLMINNVFFNQSSLVATIIGKESGFILWTSKYISPLLAGLDAGTLSLTALALAIALAYIRATQEKVDPLATVLVTVGAFFILGPQSRVSTVAPWITHYYGAMGIFVGLMVGLIVPSIFSSIVKRGWVIKMPDMVPPAVGKAFAAIIPGTITLLVIGAVPWLFQILATMGIGNEVVTESGKKVIQAYNLFEIIEQTIQLNLMKLFGSIEEGAKQPFLPGLIGAGGIKLIQTILWFAGLHGANMTQPVVAPIWGTLGNLNMKMFAETGSTVGLFPWVGASWIIYADLGGSGATLGLLIAIFLFSKRPDAKEVAKIAVPSGIFEINEPVIFGLPIVLNPIYLIPFLFATPIMSMFGYVMSYIGFAGPVVQDIPWTTPPILSAAMATNFNIGAIITAIICLGISILIYTPFVFLANKEFAEQEAEKAKLS